MSSSELYFATSVQIILSFLFDRNTAFSVASALTHLAPVNCKVQSLKILIFPPLALCCITITLVLAPAIRSITPPIPLTILSGMIQFVRSTASET